MAARLNGSKLIDIGVNLTEAFIMGKDVTLMIVTCGCSKDIQSAIELCNNEDNLFFTVGCHPTRSNEFEKDSDPDGYLNNLLKIVDDNKDKVVAIGECGLDFDRLHFCSKETQLKYFEKQFHLAEKTRLPMFLHMRNAHDDFLKLITRNRDRITTGVTHCFTGSKDEAFSLIDQGLFIGVTGCSLKTEENIEVVKSLPIEKLMIETDAPWCEIRPTHAGFKYIKTKFGCKKKEKWEEGQCVKSRNEPAHLIQVLEVLAAIKEEDIAQLAENLYNNTTRVFFKN